VLSRLGDRLAGLAEGLAEGEEREVDVAAWVGAVEAELASRLDRVGYNDLVGRLEEAAEELASDDEPGGSAVAQVAAFMEGFARPGEAVLRLASSAGGPRLRHLLLDPSVVTRERFASVHAAVLMSGTLWPPRMYADLLGLPDGRVRIGEYRSPFPPENRLVLVDRGSTTRYASRGPEMYARIVESVRAVLAAVPGNVAVFSPSYDMLRRVREGLEAAGDVPKELLVEDRGMGKRDRERLCDRLEELRHVRGGALLGVQGGSLSEGVDYLENLLSAVVVVGLPLAPPSKEVDALTAYFDRKFGAGRGEEYGYVNPAMNRVVQAAGRLIRTERDRGVVVLMDSRFLQTRYLRCFPPDWTPRAAGDLGAEVAEFFSVTGAGARARTR
jgi:DNA excision repair protein ERCC-2